MRKTVLAFCLGVLMVLTLVGCGSSTTSSTSGKLLLPIATPEQPVGATAITPTTSGIPAFSKEDVITYVKTHNIPFNEALLSQHTVEQVSFIPSKEVNAILHRQNTRIPDSYLLCFVTFHGTFVFPGPPVPPVKRKTSSITYQRAFEVFDAKTGNLLMGGGLPSRIGLAP
jgi:hypothetical protein